MKFQANGKVKNEEIYIGQDEVATKILTDLATRELIDETDITYRGETILEKIANSLNFEDILIEYTGDERASRALKNVIILMTLYKESKRRLFPKWLDKSILKNSTDIKVQSYKNTLIMHMIMRFFVAGYIVLLICRRICVV